MICITHSADLDGHCSGAIVKKAHPEAEVIGYNYGNPFPWDKIKGQEVVMVDVSLPMPEMSRLAKEALVFTWIDHHESAINDYNTASGDMQFNQANHVVLEIGKAACELAWGYFFPDKQMPSAVFLLGTYDVWRNQDKTFWEQQVMPFQYGMRLCCSSAATFPMELLNGEEVLPAVREIVQAGHTILTYQNTQNAFTMKGSFEATLKGGYRAIMCNVGGGNSNMFKTVFDPEKHDVMVPFAYVGKNDHYKVSFFGGNPDVNCYEIAKQFGGGGHRGAAGCQVEDWKQIIEE